MELRRRVIKPICIIFPHPDLADPAPSSYLMTVEKEVVNGRIRAKAELTDLLSDLGGDSNPSCPCRGRQSFQGAAT